jgi:hypothetical protein
MKTKTSGNQHRCQTVEGDLHPIERPRQDLGDRIDGDEHTCRMQHRTHLRNVTIGVVGGRFGVGEERGESSSMLAWRI